MKKTLLVTIAFFLLTTGCSSTTKIMSCTKIETQNNLNFDLNYTVEYQNNTVKNVKTVEKITTSDPTQLENYKNTVEAIYLPYKDVEYYTYSIVIEGEVLTSIADIQYDKVDTDKMIKIEPASKKLIKNGKININDIQSVYESIGATCKKE